MSCDRIVHELRGSSSCIVDVCHFTKQRTVVQTRRSGSDIIADIRHSVPHGINCVWNIIEKRHYLAPYTHIVAFGGNIALNAGPVFSRWLEVPLVTLFRGNDFDAAIFDSRKRQSIDTAMKESAVACTVSSQTSMRMKRLYPSTSICVVANAINSRHWSRLPSDNEDAISIRRAIGIEHRLVLGFFGHLKKKKGVDVFVESLALSNLNHHFQLLIVADIDPDTAAIITECSSRVPVTHLPFVDRYRTIPYYLACDFVVLPSVYDGLPNVALEAAALGCVLIATRSGGGLALSGSALLLDNDPHDGDIVALRQALYMTDEERFARGQLASEIVRKEYTPEKERDAYLSIFEATRLPDTVVSDVLQTV